jgi:hypothetical protein
MASVSPSDIPDVIWAAELGKLQQWRFGSTLKTKIIAQFRRDNYIVGVPLSDIAWHTATLQIGNVRVIDKATKIDYVVPAIQVVTDAPDVECGHRRIDRTVVKDPLRG